MSEPASYGAGAERVERIETHISLVFLAGDRSYKLKRAVKYPYADFSTVELRAAGCAAELELNRRTAPELYLDVKALRRDAHGSIGWEQGEPVDHVVVMRRFPQERLLYSIVQQGGLDPPLIHALAAHIAEFHAGAELRRNRGGGAAMQEVAVGTLDCLRPSGFDPARVAALDQAWQAELKGLRPLLDRRRDAGKVRRCHGDLHLRNVCLLDRGPVMFDCLEFSDELASIDVLYDLAFLLMDLVHRGHRGEANRLLNRYLDLTDEDDGLAAFPFFVSLRAAIRAHVMATAAKSAGSGSEETGRYLDLAERALGKPAPRLVAVGGLSGSGKSTVAARLAPELGPLPGARLLRSDVLRKHRFGVGPETRLPESAYAPQITAAVYAELVAKARTALVAGHSAVIDAVSLRSQERASFVKAAAAIGARFTGLWLEAPHAVMADRLGTRHGDASDATAEILERQLRIDPGPLDWSRIDAGSGPEATFAAAKAALVIP